MEDTDNFGEPLEQSDTATARRKRSAIDGWSTALLLFVAGCLAILVIRNLPALRSLPWP